VGPFLGAFALNQHQHFLVFFLGPRAFNQTWVENFLPAVKALDISASRKVFSDLLPVLLVVEFDSISENQVLFLSPMAFSQATLVSLGTNQDIIWVLRLAS
jgi:hypothetical protein